MSWNTLFYAHGYKLDSGQATLEVICSKQHYALKWCKPNNDEDINLNSIKQTPRYVLVFNKLYKQNLQGMSLRFCCSVED